jgi:hypothetical protein
MCLEGIFTFCDGPWQLADEECEMENINGKYQPLLMLLCATVGLAVSVSLCLGADMGNREAQLVSAPPETPFPCDSLDPKVCFDIYQRRMERIPAPILSDDQGDNGERCLMATARNPFGGYLKQHVCSSRLTRIR